MIHSFEAPDQIHARRWLNPATILLDFLDHSGIALNLDARPTNPSVFSALPDGQRVEVITSTPSPVLFIRRPSGGSVLLAWPLAAQDFHFESNINLVAGAGWVTNATANVDSEKEHAATVSAAVGNQFFRLKK